MRATRPSHSSDTTPVVTLHTLSIASSSDWSPSSLATSKCSSFALARARALNLDSACLPAEGDAAEPSADASARRAIISRSPLALRLLLLSRLVRLSLRAVVFPTVESPSPAHRWGGEALEGCQH